MQSFEGRRNNKNQPFGDGFIIREIMTCVGRTRVLREEKDLTQTEIAQMLNIGQRTYCDYELGKTRIPVDSLITLARMYNVSMDYISDVSDVKRQFPKE